MAAGKGIVASSLEHLQNHDIIESLIGTKPGDHIYLLYEHSPAEQLKAITAFIKEGLDDGEQCVYVADDMPAEKLEEGLGRVGVDVLRETERDALLIWTREHWRQPGTLDTIRKAAQVREVLEAAFRAGFSGVRFAVEMTWTLRPDIDPASIEEWESYSNVLLTPGAPVRALCLYGRQRLPSATFAAGLRNHPVVFDGSFSTRASQRGTASGSR